jgi:viroplasmin and RNaseH domain-containing protein
MTWYVVYKGWVPGVYDMWVDYQKQVHKFSGNYYEGYAAREETVAKWRNDTSQTYP